MNVKKFSLKQGENARIILACLLATIVVFFLIGFLLLSWDFIEVAIIMVFVFYCLVKWRIIAKDRVYLWIGLIVLIPAFIDVTFHYLIIGDNIIAFSQVFGFTNNYSHFATTFFICTAFYAGKTKPAWAWTIFTFMAYEMFEYFMKLLGMSLITDPLDFIVDILFNMLGIVTFYIIIKIHLYFEKKVK